MAKLNQLKTAVKLLKHGECVAIPTETVYGLAADAHNPKAIQKIFKLKGRPQHHPLILHIANKKQLLDWVESVPAAANKLIKSFWPGPMTLIFNLKKNKLTQKNTKIITGNQNTIGIRMPSHRVARKLLKLLKSPLVAPSANKFGHVSPTQADHVKAEFGNKLKLILDGGKSELGIESSIIDITEEPARLLRPGPLSINKIKKLTGIKIINNKSKKSPRVSGSLKSHYAPRTPVKLFTGNLKNKSKNSVAVGFKNSFDITMPKDPKKYGQKLYAVLRECDLKKLKMIYIELPPNKPEWLAVRDRLMRAAG